MMTEALQILDARLAKGEITEEQYEKLRARILLSSPEPAPTATVAAQPTTVTKSPPNFNLIKFWWIIPIVGLAVGYFSIKNDLVIENLSSDSPFFGDTTVTATLYNQGGGNRYSYWVTKGTSETAYCKGQIFIGSGERRNISFRCPDLTNYNGRFKLITSK
jgi:hypothetical protein